MTKSEADNRSKVWDWKGEPFMDTGKDRATVVSWFLLLLCCFCCFGFVDVCASWRVGQLCICLLVVHLFTTEQLLMLTTLTRSHLSHLALALQSPSLHTYTQIQHTQP